MFIKSPYPSNGDGKIKFDQNSSSWCNLCLKFRKNLFRIHLNFFCSVYIATTHLATIFYNKMEQIYKNTSGLLLLNSAFDVIDQKMI